MNGRHLSTGYLLLESSERFEQRLSQGLRGAGIEHIGPAQLKVLQHVAAEGLSQARLAELTGLSKQGVNKSVAELVRQGYLELRPDLRDGRARRVCLTGAGTALMRQVAGLIKEIELEFLHQLGEQYHGLRRALVQLVE